MVAHQALRISFVAVGATLVATVIPSSVSAALPDRTSLTIDCDTGELNEDDHALATGETLTVTLVNCTTWVLKDVDSTLRTKTNSGATTVTSTGVSITGSPFVFTVLENSDVQIETDDFVIDDPETEADEGVGEKIDLDVSVGFPLDPSSGELLVTDSVTFSGDLDEFTVLSEYGTDAGSPGAIYLNGIEECKIITGQHIYKELRIDVLEAGTYTFRKIWNDPIHEDIFWGVPQPQLRDSFLALYNGFDPIDPTVNLVTCNDDVDDVSSVWSQAESFRASRSMTDALIETSSGFIIDNQFPWISAVLQPGSYSLILTNYRPLAVAWTGTETIAYEMWGPRGGIRNRGLRIDVDESLLDRYEEIAEQLPDTL